jgi:hypothetical protein
VSYILMADGIIVDGRAPLRRKHHVGFGAVATALHRSLDRFVEELTGARDIRAQAKTAIARTKKATTEALTRSIFHQPDDPVDRITLTGRADLLTKNLRDCIVDVERAYAMFEELKSLLTAIETLPSEASEPPALGELLAATQVPSSRPAYAKVFKLEHLSSSRATYPVLREDDQKMRRLL